MELEAGEREWEVTCSRDDGHATRASEKRLPTPFPSARLRQVAPSPARRGNRWSWARQEASRSGKVSGLRRPGCGFVRLVGEVLADFREFLSCCQSGSCSFFGDCAPVFLKLLDSPEVTIGFRSPVSPRGREARPGDAAEAPGSTGGRLGVAPGGGGRTRKCRIFSTGW